MTKKQAFLLGVCVGIGLLLLVGFAQRPQTGDATPADLRPAYRELYMDLIARAYAADPSLDLQMLLGEDWTPELSQTTLQALLDKTPASAQEARGRITQLATALKVSVTSPRTTSSSRPSSFFANLMLILFVLSISLLVVIFVGKIGTPLKTTLVALMTRKKYPAATAPEYVREYKHVVAPTPWEGESTLPMLQFTSTYTLGDDRYDPSRSIETPKGKFLGECGVGMVSASKQGQSRLAPAFEVWLFDKNDTRTQTHILLSEYAAHDEEIHPRLVKDHPSSLAEPGMIISLQTATLQLRAKVVDVQYLAHDQRYRCYFERLALEVAVWQI